jgi:uncharacterized protein (TIGR03083 family)
MSAQGSKEFWLESLRVDGHTFLANAAEADLTLPVPSCPGWSVLDLIHHLGGLYRYVQVHVARGVTSKPDPELRDKLVNQDLPPATETVAWFASQLEGLHDLLNSLDQHMPAWNWAPQAKVVAFWPRRMSHETAVHRWDIQMALHGLAEPIEQRLAADGVAEVLDTWLPAGRRKGPLHRYGVVQLAATDVGQEWFLRLRGEGFALLDTATILDDTDPHEQVVAAGTASDLQLALMGRVGFDVLDVAGDESLLATLRTG